MAKYMVSVFGVIAAMVCLILVFSERAESAPALYDYDNLRDLYEILLRNEGIQSNNQFVHQMERKGGRSPTLRLRFGKRSDPLWSSSGPISSDNNSEKFN